MRMVGTMKEDQGFVVFFIPCWLSLCYNHKFQNIRSCKTFGPYLAFILHPTHSSSCSFNQLTLNPYCKNEINRKWCSFLHLWRYQEELPTAIAKREPKYLTKDELTKLMKWKLTVSRKFSNHEIALFFFLFYCPSAVKYILSLYALFHRAILLVCLCSYSIKAGSIIYLVDSTVSSI